MPAPGAAGAAGTAARGRAAEPAPGPGGPGRTSTTAAAIPQPTDPTTPAAARVPIAATVAHYRLRQSEPRTNRVSPRFNKPEWHDIETAAVLCAFKPGAFIASATEALLRPGTLHRRRWLEGTIRANHTLATVGDPLNSFARHLNSGCTPHEHAHHLLARVTTAIDTTRTAIAWTGPADTETTTERTTRIHQTITRHRRRSDERRDIRRRPRFSDHHWTDLTATATACSAEPGALVAAAAIDAARSPDPRAATADTRRHLEELMETNRLLAALGNNLNQIQHQLPFRSGLHDQARQLLGQVENTLDHVDTTAADLIRR